MTACCRCQNQGAAPDRTSRRTLCTPKSLVRPDHVRRSVLCHHVSTSCVIVLPDYTRDEQSTRARTLRCCCCDDAVQTGHSRRVVSMALYMYHCSCGQVISCILLPLSTAPSSTYAYHFPTCVRFSGSRSTKLKQTISAKHQVYAEPRFSGVPK